MKKTIFSIFSVLLLPLLLTCALAEETSTPQLQKLKHTVVSPVSEQVVLQLNGSYSPKVFTLKDEMPRIIFDFPDMTYGREIKGVTTTNGSIVKRIRVGMHVQDTPKTRIVFDVATLKGVTYTQHFDENTSTLTVQFNTTAKVAKTAPAVDKKPAMASDTAEMPAAPPQAEASVQAEPETASEAPIKATKESDPGPDPAKPLAEAKETDPPQPMVAGEKVGEKKTPAVTPEPKQPTPSAETKAAVKSEAAPSKSDTTAKPPAKEPSPQPVITADASGDKKVPPPAPPQPSPTIEAKTTAKPETAPTSEDDKIKPTAKEPAPQPPDAAASKNDEKTPPTISPPPEAASTKPPAKAEATKPAALLGTAAGARLESVKFDGSSPKGEMVLFKLNDFHPPVIHGVEEGVPRVICDFNNTQLVDLGKNLIKTDGKFVKLIRITRNKKPDRVRVVLDLEPNRSYDLQQVFFKEDNLFVIIVNAIKK